MSVLIALLQYPRYVFYLGFGILILCQVRLCQYLNMQEVLAFATTLQKKDLPESTLQTLVSLAQEFVELGDVCLLVLHLEVQ